MPPARITALPSSIKAAMAAATQEEETMRLITSFDLANRSETELAVLFWAVTRTLTCSDPDTPERRNALASLENISRARIARRLQSCAP